MGHSYATAMSTRSPAAWRAFISMLHQSLSSLDIYHLQQNFPRSEGTPSQAATAVVPRRCSRVVNSPALKHMRARMLSTWSS